jgi:hypothetical protein
MFVKIRSMRRVRHFCYVAGNWIPCYNSAVIVELSGVGPGIRRHRICAVVRLVYYGLRNAEPSLLNVLPS